MLNGLAVALDGDEERSQRALECWSRQGFQPVVKERFHGGVIYGFVHARRGGEPGDHHLVRVASRFACCAGTIWYRKRFGEDALRLLLEDLPSAPASLDFDRSALRGNFALFLSDGRQASLVNDALGLQQVYCTDDNRYFGTSWLAARAHRGSGEIDEDAAVEYVLLGASYSDRTVARRIRKLPLGHDVRCDHRDVRVAMAPRTLDRLLGHERAPTSFDAAVEATTAHLREVFGEIVAALSGRIKAALSGGFDSRLILAALLSLGERPRLFVYGSAGSADVAIASEVARHEGLLIDTIDKEAMDRDRPMPDVDRLTAAALFFDGLPNDGIDDPGSDQATRLAQNADGWIALNGGGGEIFRNFFHLPDRSFRARDVVRAFFRSFDAGVFRVPDGLDRYQRTLATSLARSVRPGDAARPPDERTVLSRTEIELVYPLFRCRHWMGVNNSALLRHGFFGTPLVDATAVREAARLPLAWKNAGLFESRLIRALHPGVSTYRSAYGFRISDGPSASARLSEALTCARPPFARPLINALHRRLRPTARGVSTRLERYRTLLPGEWALDSRLDFQRIDDPSTLARLLALEIVVRQLPP